MKALLERTGFIRAAPGDPPRKKDISELTRERINLGATWFMVIGLVLAEVGII
jgi:hypothetical protein